jgi:hypothetical protein
MIDFNDPNELMNHGETIPINTPEKYQATREACIAIYTASIQIFDADADQQLERRVRSGQTTEQIIAHTLQDRRARFNEE